MYARQLAVALALALSTTAACNNAPDPTDRAEKALKDAQLNDVNVDWDKDARIAHLKGTVDSPTDKARAEDVAGTAIGTSGKVLNEVTIKGLNEHSADDLDGRIRSQLSDMIKADAVLKDRDVDFDVSNGVVTAKGNVRTVAEKTKVTEMMRSAPGVKDFANAVEIKPEK